MPDINFKKLPGQDGIDFEELPGQDEAPELEGKIPSLYGPPIAIDIDRYKPLSSGKIETVKPIAIGIDRKKVSDAYIDAATMSALTGKDVQPKVAFQTRDALDKQHKKTEDSWGQVLTKSSLAVGPSLMKGSAGLVRELEEFLQPDLLTEERKERLGIKPGVPQGYLGPTPIETKFGEEAGEFWEKRLRAVDVNFGSNQVKRYAGLITTNVIQNLPFLGAGILAKSSTIPLMGMGLVAKGSKYEDLRKRGVDENTARLMSTVVGVSEAATEKLGFDALIKSGIPFAKRLLLTSTLDVPGELINTSVEAVVDKVTIDPGMTYEEYVKALMDTAIVSLGSAGALTTISHPLVAMRESQDKKERVLSGEPIETIDTTAQDEEFNKAFNLPEMPSEVEQIYEEARGAALDRGLNEEQSTDAAMEALKATEEGQAYLENASKGLVTEEVAEPSIEDVFERIVQEDLTEEELTEVLESVAGGREAFEEQVVSEPVAAIKQRLLDVGMDEVEASSNAALFDGFRVLAERAGISPEAVIERFLPQITREAPEVAEVTDEDRAAISDNTFLSERFTTEEQLSNPDLLANARESLNNILEDQSEEQTFSDEEIQQVKDAIGFIDQRVGAIREQPVQEPLPGDGAPRGRIRFAPTGINIELLKDADQSTFVHETGHLYFRLMRDLSSLETATPELKQDFETVRDWLGVTEEQQGEITREQEEQFARGFEAFLMEGKAPTPALRQAFENFKQWLMEVYQSLLDLDVTLTDDVRGVMDRMLADEGIEVAEPAEIRPPPLEEAEFEQPPAAQAGLKPTFAVNNVATEMIPETTTDLLPSKAEKGIYYTATVDELQAYLDTHGDGFLYRATHVRSIDEGFDKGNPDYSHRFKDNVPRKTIALTTSLQDAKKHLDNIEIDDHTILYRVQPQDLAGDFAIQIPSARTGEVVHVHSPQPPSTALTDVVFRRQEFQEVSPDDSRRLIEERRTARIERRAEERPVAEGLRPGVRRGRPEGVEVLEQEVTPKKPRKVPVKTQVRKVTGQVKDPELKTLRDDFIRAARAARAAFKAGDKEGVARERARMQEIAQRAKIRTAETVSINKLKKSILKEIKTTAVKKVGGKPRGKFGADIQAVLDGFRDAVKMTNEQATNKINENLDKYIEIGMPDEVVIENRILDMVARLKEIPEAKQDEWAVKMPDTKKAIRTFDTEDEAFEFKATQQDADLLEVEFRAGEIPKAKEPLRKRFTADELTTLLEEIKALKNEGKMLTELKRLQTKERHAELVEDAVNVIMGGKPLPEGLETVGVEQKKPPVKEFTAWLENFTSNLGVHFVGWNDLMDMMSSREKISEPGKSRLNEMTNVHANENAKKLGQREQTTQIADIAKESFDFKSDREMLRQFNLDAKEIEIGIFVNSHGTRVNLNMTKAEARKFVMEYSDPALRETFVEGMKFTDEMVKAIKDTLTTQDMVFIEKQQEFYRTYYDRVNEVYRELYGTDLPFNEFYSPIRREGFDAPDGLFGEFLDETSYRRSVTSGSFKSRVKNVRRIAKQSDVNVLERHIAEMEHFIAWAEKIKDLNAIFKNQAVRSAIKLHHEPSMLFVVDKFINDFTRGGIETAARLDALDKFRGNFTRSVLAVKPNITIKQLTSAVAYMEVMPVTDFTLGVADFWANPLEKFRFLKKNSVWFKERGAHMERDIKTAIRMKEYSSFREAKGFMDALMLNVHLGDQGAIAIGGWSYYKYLTEKKGMSQSDAIVEFEKFSEMTQQSSDLSLQSDIQRMGSFAKLFSMFLSAPNLYMRKELGAIRNLLAGRGDKVKHMKTIAIYHMVLPMFFQWVSDAFDWDEDEQLRAVILGPLNGLFIVGDAIDGIIRKALGLRTFSKEVAIYSAANDLEKATSTAIKLISEGRLTDAEFYRGVRGLAGGVGAFTGLPMKQAVDQVKTGVDFVDGEYEKALKELLGFSPFLAEKQSKGQKGR